MGVIGIESDLGQRVAVARHAVLLAVTVVLGATAVFSLGLFADRPITFPDEVIYGGLARSLAAGQGFDVAGNPFSPLTYGPIYPVLIAPLFWIAPSIHDAYFAARALNALMFASAAIPVWLIARRLVTQRTALLRAAGSIALPASVYSTKLQTESVAYPVVMWGVLATLCVLAQPSLRHQFLLLAYLFSAPLVRFQLLALIPSLLAACLLCTPGPVRARVRRLLPLIIGALSTALAVAFLVLASAASGANESHGLELQLASVRGFVVELIRMVAALDLYTGILPFAVFVVVLFGIRRTSRPSVLADGEVRTLAILTLSLAISLATLGSFYLAAIPAAARPPAPPDRYVFYVVPLMFILFAWWVEHGAPRPTAMRWVAPTAAALPLIVAVAAVDGRGLVATSNALSFMPWMFLRALVPGSWWLFALGAYCCLCAGLAMKVSLSTRWLVKPITGAIVVITLSSFAYVSGGSWNARTHTPPAGWLDARTNDEVIGVWVNRPTDRQAFALWEIDAMNRNLTRVHYIRRPDSFGPQTKLIQRSDGQLLDHGKPMFPRYVLTSWRTPVVGRLVARSSGLALYEVRPPLRLAMVSATSERRASTTSLVEPGAASALKLVAMSTRASRFTVALGER